MNDPTPLSIYQFRAVLNGVSPMVWRRILLASETSLAGLHEVLQLAFGWSGFYLYEFFIHGKTFSSNAEDPRLEATIPLHEDLTFPRYVGGSTLHPTSTTVAHGITRACQTIRSCRLWKHCRCLHSANVRPVVSNRNVLSRSSSSMQSVTSG
jgi:hypothetical protein